MTQRARHSLARAVSIYGGDFLPKTDSDWALLERQRLRTLYLDSLYQLTASYEHVQDHLRAIAYGRRLSAIEPLREDVHRILMRAYVASGNRAKAIEQYRICEAELGRELDVSPMAETQALFHEISQPDVGPLVTNGARAVAGWNAAAEHLHWIRRALRQTDERLAETINLIEQRGTIKSTI